MTSTTESARNTPKTAWRQPIYRVLDGQEACEVRIELPGVPKAGVSIHLEDGLLTVTGQRLATVPETWQPLHREIPAENSLLRLRLNTPVDEDRLEARLEHGVLSLRLPRREAARPRRIEIH